LAAAGPRLIRVLVAFRPIFASPFDAQVDINLAVCLVFRGTVGEAGAARALVAGVRSLITAASVLAWTAGAFVDVCLTVEPSEALYAHALVKVDLVEALAGVLAGGGRAFVDVGAHGAEAGAVATECAILVLLARVPAIPRG
jgi:hypothetical protein